MGPSSDSLFVYPEHRACGNEILGLYGEGISKMAQNPGIPPLFRDIFKNAYLPYRDPETLKAFLKIIDEFSYDHSERLGDAFEYLLSVLGSQGDAGQFRTPRHRKDRPPAGQGRTRRLPRSAAQQGIQSQRPVLIPAWGNAPGKRPA